LLEQHLRHERIAVGDGADDLESVVTQQAGQPVAEQREVLGDHYAHGRTARTVVGPPTGLVTSSVPSTASTRRASPRSPLPLASAPPAPLSTTLTIRLPFSVCTSISTLPP